MPNDQAYLLSTGNVPSSNLRTETSHQG